jgi:amino acid transporter
MAYEGFQLLTYDYDDIRDPHRTLPRAIFLSIPLVIVVYMAVAVGTPMLVGADTVVEHGEVSLALAGQEAFGTVGLVLVSVAAAFSTGSAINATLFATARLSFDVAAAGELPRTLEHRNAAGVPDRAVIVLGLAAAAFATFGSLSSLVESASLAFLFTFSVVSGLAFVERAGSRFLTGLGALGAGLSTVVLALRLARTAPVALIGMAVMVLLATVGRPLILRRSRTE